VFRVKYYEQLIDMGCFSKADIAALTGNEHTANSLLYAYKKRGLIENVRRDLFVAISLETKQPIPNRYVIASNIADSAYVTHHSAFEYYGYANQVYYDVYVASGSRFREFEYDGLAYKHVTSAFNAGVDEKKDGVSVTDMERTVIDSINDFEKIGGLEELLRCLDLVPHLDAARLTAYLNAYNKGFLYQRAGYLLEHFKGPLKLPEEFFNQCQRAVPKSKRYLYQGLMAEQHTLDSNWRLFVPVDLSAVIKKGGVFIE
jgi:predicted transcriptional regulator of viral defense system